MDQNEQYKKVQNSSQSHKFLKMAMQLIVSITLLSIFVSHSSFLCYYIHYYKFQLSTLIFPLFTHTIERKYMFLLCNGILALLVKSSGSSSSTGSDFHGNLTKSNIEDGVKLVMSKIESGVRFEENFVPLHEEEGEEGEEKLNGSLVTEVKEMKNGDLIIYSEENEELEEEVELSDWSLIPASSLVLEEEEEEEEEGNEEVKLMSTEELNRKFDEFIRKMKEEIRIDAQRQLIAV